MIEFFGPKVVKGSMGGRKATIRLNTMQPSLLSSLACKLVGFKDGDRLLFCRKDKDWFVLTHPSGYYARTHRGSTAYFGIQPLAKIILKDFDIPGTNARFELSATPTEIEGVGPAWQILKGTATI